MSAAVALVLSGQATVAQAARQFEVDPQRLAARAWAEARRVVLERDSHCCLNCGRLATDVHHRAPKKAGGTSDPERAFAPQVLVSLCRDCHSDTHAEKPEMHDRGYMLTRGQNPAEVPVMVRAEWGYERFWLLPSGETSRTDPRRVAA